MKLRIAKTRRLILIEEMDKTCFPGEPIDKIEKQTWFLATLDGQPAGYAAIKILDSGVAYLSRAGVLPAFRGQGLQKKLIKARERYARNQDCNTLITYTMVKGCSSPNSLVSCGYRLYRPQYAWAGEDWLYFIKHI